MLVRRVPLSRLLLLAVLLTAVLFLNTRKAFPQSETEIPRPAQREMWPHLAPDHPHHHSGQYITAIDLVPFSRLVFQSLRDSNDWDIYKSNDNQSGQFPLTNNNTLDIHPRFNRDATKVVFAHSQGGNDDFEIYKMNADGSGLTQLTNNSSDDGNPYWSPDGSRIVFEAYRDGHAEIYIMNADGSNQTRLTYYSSFDGYPTWSPDGSKIAFTSRRDGDYRIYTMDTDGSNQTRRSNQPFSFHPAWSPDSSRIAFDADSDGDGWQEIWVMNADGSGQSHLYTTTYQTDAWVRGWSPDGRYISFTDIHFIYFEGNWYWDRANLMAYNMIGHSTILMGLYEADWYPDWQSLDPYVPVSHINTLPTTSPATFTVSWVGSDTGISGIKNYDVQVKNGSGQWQDWLVGTNNSSAVYTGSGGTTYYFRSRVRDNAGNVEAWPATHDGVTTIEAIAPSSTIDNLPAYSAVDGFLVTWNGSDPGNSGIQKYDIQYRSGNDSSWVNWQTNTSAQGAYFTVGNSGEMYHFRVRATDHAGNVEAWPSGNGDSSTTLYQWAIRGQVTDNAGTPIQGINLISDPSALYTLTGDSAGNYANYVGAQAGTYTVDWHKSGYGDLPTASLMTEDDVILNIVLPPADNILNNSGFETGDLQPDWLATGTNPPILTNTVRNTGEFAAFLGQGTGATSQDTFIGSGSSPLIALGSDQTVHILWRDYSGSLFYRKRNSDNTWSAIETVAGNISPGVQHAIAVDGNGTVHIIWEVIFDGLYYTQRAIGGVWSAPYRIQASSAPWLNAKMQVTPDGTVHVIWEFNTGFAHDIFYRKRTPNGIWSATENATNSTQNDSNSQMRVSNGGVVHIISTADLKSLVYNQRSANGVWSSSETIFSDLYTYIFEPKIIVDNSGALHVTWYFQGDSLYHYVKRDNSGTWSTPFPLATGDGIITHDLAVGVDGAVHFVYGGYTQSGYRRRIANGAWSETQRLVGPFTDGIQNPQIVTDATGLGHLVWAKENNVYYSRQNSDGLWSRPQILTEQPGGDPTPKIALDAYNLPHIVWDGAYYNGPIMANTATDSSLAQVVTLPLTITTPVLSFLYKIGNAMPSAGSQMSVIIEDKSSSTPLLTLERTTPEWEHSWVDLGPWVGKSVTVTFHLHQEAEEPVMWGAVDEITVGAAHPDVWVNLIDTNGLPGETVTYAINYANRGGITAENTYITYTFPAEITFVNASLSPLSVTGSTVVWDVGNLAPDSQTETLVVTGTIASNAASFANLISTVDITTATAELETLNNTAQGSTFIGRLIYIPLIFSR